MRKSAIALCAAVLLAAGCASSYYKVTDPTTGKVYYTDQLTKHDKGSVTLKDGMTGNMVNVQNSEITEISKEQYDVARYSDKDMKK